MLPPDAVVDCPRHLVGRLRLDKLLGGRRRRLGRPGREVERPRWNYKRGGRGSYSCSMVGYFDEESIYRRSSETWRNFVKKIWSVRHREKVNS